MPESQTITRAFKYRIYPTKSQVAALELHLSEACQLYNAALQERRDAWRLSRKRISFYDQSRQLKEIRAAGDTGIASFTTAERVLRRVDHAFAAFYRRVKAGQKPGYPRFRSASRFDSLDCRVGNGVNIRDGRLWLTGIAGGLKVKWHREQPGRAKSVTIRREGHRWNACIECDVEPVPLPQSSKVVGIDVGLSSLATLSDGSYIQNPRHDRLAERGVRLDRRRLARCQRHSNRRKAVVLRLRGSLSKIARQRADAHHKAARSIVSRYGYIAVEDLNIRGLARTRLARSIHDAAWASFIDKLTYKAESAGRVLVKVNPRGTSQTCLCGASVPKTLAVREHACHECGLIAPRDLVSAQLIERLGRSRWSLTDLAGGC